MARCKDCIHGEVCDIFVHTRTLICNDNADKICKMFKPTADVVPKSEVGAECPTCHGTGRIGTTDWLTKNISKEQLAKEKAEAIAEHELHIKQDYARKIFAELESVLCFFEYPSLTALGKINVIRADGWHIRADDYRTIKKKYEEPEV